MSFRRIPLVFVVVVTVFLTVTGMAHEHERDTYRKKRGALSGTCAIGIDFVFDPYSLGITFFCDECDGYIGMGDFDDDECLEALESAIHIDFGDGFNVITSRSFLGLSNLKSVNISSGVTEIAESAFEGCTSLSSVILPNTLESIGENAFFQCTSLTSIRIPDSVTTLGVGAFSFCYSLESVNIPSGVTTIEFATFSDCISLSSVIIPENIEVISDYSFYRCESLSTVIISDGVTTILESAFSYCTNLSVISIPGSVNDIGSFVFYGCDSLVSIEVDDSNDNYKSIDGVLFEIQQNDQLSLVQYPDGRKGNYTIPEGVIEVKEGAFSVNEWLQSVTLPSTLAVLYLDSFDSCWNFVDINVVDSNLHFKSVDGVLFDQESECLTLVRYPPGRVGSYTIPMDTCHIGSGAFYACSGLKSVSIPSCVNSIGSHAFHGCDQLKTIKIPDSCESIEEGVFVGCTSLTDLLIPNSVKSIEDLAFSACVSLKNVTIPSRVADLGDGLFADCSGLEFVSILSETKTIPDSLFSNCDSLLSVIVPDSVTSIKDSAFSGCSKLTNFSIPQRVKSIGNEAFYGCKQIDFLIPETVTSIGASAFEECSSLSAINIPSGVKTLSNRAFYGCRNLRSIQMHDGLTSVKNEVFSECVRLTSVSFPSSVSSIGKRVFSHCLSLQNVVVQSDKASIGSEAFIGCKNLVSIRIPSKLAQINSGVFQGCSSLPEFTIPSTVDSIGKSAFSGCSNLTSVSIPSSVRTIRERVFSGCTQLLSVALSDGIESIRNFAFSGCNNITKIFIPSSVNDVRERAFSGMNNLEEIVVDESNPFYMTNKDGVLYSHTNRVIKELVRFPAGMKIENYDIQSVVEVIRDYAFDGCDGLVSINIPPSVIKIGNHSFSGVNRLLSINVDRNNLLFKSDDGVLINTVEHSLMKFPNGKRGNYTIPKGTEIIGYQAFCNSSLSRVFIPSSVTTIGMYPFDGCYDLIAIDVDDSSMYFKSVDGVLLNHEGDRIIQFPKGRSGEYTIPDGITSIQAKTFSGSHLLTNIYVPAGVETIDKKSFSGCGSLVSISVDPTNEFFKSINGVLFNHDGQILLECPEGRAGEYDIPTGTASVREQAFHGCGKLTSVRIPASLESIGAYAFCGCSELETLTIEDGLKTIGDYSFSGCYKLISVTIPASVVSMGSSAFSECHRLEVVSYFGKHDLVTFNGEGDDYVFGQCEMLHHICLPLDYDDFTFCGRADYCQTDSCESLVFNDGFCYEEGCYYGGIENMTKKNVTEWEERSDACANFLCDEKLGLVVETVCLSTKQQRLMCMNDGCIDMKYLKSFVEINVSAITIDTFDVDVLAEYISEHGGIDIPDVGLELGDGGTIIRIIVPVDDEQQQQTIEDLLKVMDKDIICQGKSDCEVSVPVLIQPSRFSMDISGSRTHHETQKMVLLFGVTVMFAFMMSF